MVEEPETTQTQESEAEVEVHGIREDAEENKVEEEVVKEEELKASEVDEHRTMPEHPGRDSDSEDSEPEDENEKWSKWFLYSYLFWKTNGKMQLEIRLLFLHWLFKWFHVWCNLFFVFSLNAFWAKKMIGSHSTEFLSVM